VGIGVRRAVHEGKVPQSPDWPPIGTVSRSLNRKDKKGTKDMKNCNFNGK